jgi:hypothetical protein
MLSGKAVVGRMRRRVRSLGGRLTRLRLMRRLGRVLLVLDHSGARVVLKVLRRRKALLGRRVGMLLLTQALANGNEAKRTKSVDDQE